MTSTTATIAETYYKTLAKKDVTALEKYLHPDGTISSSALMTIKDGLVVKIELFYDARPFEPKK